MERRFENRRNLPERRSNVERRVDENPDYLETNEERRDGEERRDDPSRRQRIDRRVNDQRVTNDRRKSSRRITDSESFKKTKNQEAALPDWVQETILEGERKQQETPSLVSNISAIQKEDNFEKEGSSFDMWMAAVAASILILFLGAAGYVFYFL